MPDQQDLPKPYMWVPEDKSKRLNSNYIELQLPQLSTLIGKNETISLYFPLDSFEELLTHRDDKLYFHISIGSYDDTSDSPKDEQNNLMLLFSFSNDDITVGKIFFSLNPQGNFVEDKKAKTWIQNYESKKVSVLINNLDENDRKNYTKSGKFTDTLMISHELRHVDELIEEIYRQNVDYPQEKITGLLGIFSSFSKSDHPEPPTTPCYVKRLFVLFELAGQDRHIIYLDRRPGFLKRKTQVIFPGVDNGHLCPPGCP